MLREGGVTSYWRGNGINVLKIGPESALKFAAYEQVKRYIKGYNNNKELNIYERFIAGSVAGGFSQSIIYPLEVSFFFRTFNSAKFHCDWFLNLNLFQI